MDITKPKIRYIQGGSGPAYMSDHGAIITTQTKEYHLSYNIFYKKVIIKEYDIVKKVLRPKDYTEYEHTCKDFAEFKDLVDAFLVDLFREWTMIEVPAVRITEERNKILSSPLFRESLYTITSVSEENIKVAKINIDSMLTSFALPISVRGNDYSGHYCNTRDIEWRYWRVEDALYFIDTKQHSRYEIAAHFLEKNQAALAERRREFKDLEMELTKQEKHIDDVIRVYREKCNA